MAWKKVVLIGDLRLHVGSVGLGCGLGRWGPGG